MVGNSPTGVSWQPASDSRLGTDSRLGPDSRLGLDARLGVDALLGPVVRLGCKYDLCGRSSLQSSACFGQQKGQEARAPHELEVRRRRNGSS